jgi:AAA ATPase domain
VRPIMGEIVGRDAELAELERFIETIPNGAGGLALVGARGIGKTTLWSTWARPRREPKASRSSCASRRKSSRALAKNRRELRPRDAQNGQSPRSRLERR